jgi:hypothetical protein
MARRTLDKGTRVLLATAAVVLGLALGIAIIVVARSGHGGTPTVYQPFFAGQSDRVTKAIKEDGPVFYPDPRKGDRAFYLDLDGDQIVALHVVPPGGTAACLVQWHRAQKRYEDCHGAAVDRSTLERFPVLTKRIGDKISVFVDLRTITPPPAQR